MSLFMPFPGHTRMPGLIEFTGVTCQSKPHEYKIINCFHLQTFIGGFIGLDVTKIM